MTTEQLIDGYAWALTVELMKLVGDRFPATDRPGAFFDLYVRSTAALQCFEERRRQVMLEPGDGESWIDSHHGAEWETDNNRVFGTKIRTGRMA